MATILQQSAYTRTFTMVDAIDKETGKTGLSPTVLISKGGAAFAAPAGTVSEIGYGNYTIALTNADTNTAGDLLYHITASGAQDVDFTDQIITQAQLDAQQIGTTGTFAPTRNELVAMAFRKIKVLGEGQTLDGNKLAEGIRTLNLLVRELDGSGSQIWGYGGAPANIALQEQVRTYDGSNGFPTNCVELVQVTYRGPDGVDIPISVTTIASFERIENKFQTGTPELAVLIPNRVLASRSLMVWPLPHNVGTQSKVVGLNLLGYNCIRSHTASSTNQPGAGANWRLYWEQVSYSPSEVGVTRFQWVTGTSYTAPKFIRIWYKRLLADFSAANDNPDFPAAKSRQLLYELASDLAFDYGKPLDVIQALRMQGERSERRTFARTEKERSTNIHNKAKYY